jgi:hypothetical protein
MLTFLLYFQKYEILLLLLLLPRGSNRLLKLFLEQSVKPSLELETGKQPFQ